MREFTLSTFQHDILLKNDLMLKRHDTLQFPEHSWYNILEKGKLIGYFRDNFLRKRLWIVSIKSEKESNYSFNITPSIVFFNSEYYKTWCAAVEYANHGREIFLLDVDDIIYALYIKDSNIFVSYGYFIDKPQNMIIPNGR